VIRSSRRARLPRRLLIVAVAGLVPVLAGCEAGNNAPTLQWHQPTPGASAHLGGITISNVFVLGAPLNATLDRGQSTGLFFGLVNTGSPDKLISISAPVARSVTLRNGPVSLPDEKAVLLTGPVPTAVLENLRQPLDGGSSIRVTMTFQNAGSVTMNVPVQPRADYYSTYSPPPAPSSPPSPAGKGRKHHGASPSPSPSSGSAKSPAAAPTPSPTG
jgi:copper(I)-binding protein